MDEENFETYYLILLENSLQNNPNRINILRQLRSSINYIKTFHDDKLCQEYIESLTNNDRVVFVVNAQIGKDIIPRIHHLEQLTSIYVICIDKSRHKIWTNQYRKIKCLISLYDELYSQIEYDQKRRNHHKIDEPLSISIFHDNNNPYDFAYTQFLFDCLMKMSVKPSVKDRFIDYCANVYRENDNELLVLSEFKQEYTSSKCIFWLTRFSFISKLISKAIRIQNFEILFLFRFYFHDILNQLEQIKCVKTVRVYRTQFLSDEQYDLLKNSIGNIISINTFLLTNLNRKQSISYLKESVENTNYHRILFEIDADPNLKSIYPFANITSLSYSSGEQQILFMCGSLFKINEINQDDQQQLIIIHMTLCSKIDEDLKFSDINQELDFIQFGQMLTDIKKFDQAHIYYNQLIEEKHDDDMDIYMLYDALGHVLLAKEEYDLSIQTFEKSLKIKMSLFDLYDPSIISSYNSIALVYISKNNSERALEIYEKIIEINQEKFGEDNLNSVECLYNMAMVYRNEKFYQKAIDVYNKVFLINKKHFPDDHPNIAMVYNNFGIVYSHLNEYDLAIEYYKKALDIYDNVLPREHYLISTILENIANIYYDKQDYYYAYIYYQEAADNYRLILPLTHPDVLQIQMVINRLQSKVKK